MKIALCFSGFLRTISIVWKNNCDKIIDPLSRNNQVDLFGYFPIHDPFIDSIKWKSLSIKDDKIFDDQLIKRITSNHRCCGDHRVPKLLNMWNNWKEVENLKRRVEIDENFTYDWVFRMRPDTWFDIPLENISTLQNTNIYIPKHDNWSGYNDRFALSSSKNMTVYHSIIDHYEQIFNRGVTFHVEEYLKIHLDTNNIPIKRTDTTLLLHRGQEMVPIYWN